MDLTLSTIQSDQTSNIQNQLQMDNQSRFQNGPYIPNSYALYEPQQMSKSTKSDVSRTLWETIGMIQLYRLNLDKNRSRQVSHPAMLIILRNSTKKLTSMADYWNLFIDQCSRHGWIDIEEFQVLCQKYHRLLQGSKNFIEEVLLGVKPTLKRFQCLYDRIHLTQQIFAQKVNKFQTNQQEKQQQNSKRKFNQEERILIRLPQAQIPKAIDKKQIQHFQKNSLSHQLKLSKQKFRYQHEGQFDEMQKQEERKKIRKVHKNQQFQENCQCYLI